MSARPPSWVSAPPAEAGSIDPLGYQAEVDRISEGILPGVTVFTTRIRYLSFLAWALAREPGRSASVDRWDVALSIGEHLRHQPQDDCKYLGVRLLKQRGLSYHDRLPLRLHSPPARLRYSGLLRSCGFWDKKDTLTEAGEALAESFEQHTPHSLPRIVGACDRMPCLSAAGARELKRLHAGLLEHPGQGQLRYETFRELGKQLLRGSRSVGPHVVLRRYLRMPGESRTAHALHQAAVLELEALPLNRLFHFLYKHGGEKLKGHLPTTKRLTTPYYIPSPLENWDGFIGAIAAHLDCAERMGRPPLPRNMKKLKEHLIALHRGAKPDGPWVDESWHQLRKGLAPKTETGTHGFRLPYFASLLSDLGVI